MDVRLVKLDASGTTVESAHELDEVAEALAAAALGRRLTQRARHRSLTTSASVVCEMV
jgi:hypothetical protein